MSHLSRILDSLPPIYSIESDSILSTFLDAIALEMDTFQEDLDRYQRSHWIGQVYRLSDAEKMGALLGIDRLPWEQLDMYRERLLALTRALLAGATGPRQIRRFVYDYLIRAETVLDSMFVPGLRNLQFDEAYGTPAGQPRYRPLALIENPSKQRRSATLQSIDGRLPYLYRWRESNKGLSETVPVFQITGVFGGGTAVPILVNLTTGDLIGYAGVLRFGQTLTLLPGASRLAESSVNDRPAKGVFSASAFQPGVPFTKDKLDPQPLIPRMARGVNEWLFLSVGLYDIKGLDEFFFAMADAKLREGVFDRTTFDNALFPSGIKARLEMTWMETEPASFQVRVPRYIVAGQAYEQVSEALRSSIGELHAAGVRAGVFFDPFVEVQPQRERFELMAKTFEPETGSAGEGETVSIGARFGESPLGGSRFE